MINDIEAYPEYMHGCANAKILRQGQDAQGIWLEAELTIKKVGFEQSFATRNYLFEPDLMKMELISGPFSIFSGQWCFKPLADNACKIIFTLEYAFKHKLFALAGSRIFESVAAEQVTNLCERAKNIYG